MFQNLIEGNNFFQKKLGVPNYKSKLPHRGEAALCKQLREHDQKAALSSGLRNSKNKPRVSKNSATCRIRIGDLATLSFTHWPLSHGCLISPQTSHYYTKLHMLINCQFDTQKWHQIRKKNTILHVKNSKV